jgi:hypothetical protein
MSDKQRQTVLQHFGKGVGVLFICVIPAGGVWSDFLLFKTGSDLMD